MNHKISIWQKIKQWWSNFSLYSDCPDCDTQLIEHRPPCIVCGVPSTTMIEDVENMHNPVCGCDSHPASQIRYERTKEGDIILSDIILSDVIKD